ncbi:hypothetical protein [Paraburkholderia kururiensis]|uniref:hypothetical protein n=1 Tax=Paraburkholderia kururiensis TaxID=984307 RepID=UPI0014702A12|nr:hypothetical protein [Paraburkholderia kururiensis]
MPQSIKRPLIDIVKTLENTIGAPPLTLRPEHHRNGHAGYIAGKPDAEPPRPEPGAAGIGTRASGSRKIDRHYATLKFINDESSLQPHAQR